MQYLSPCRSGAIIRQYQSVVVTSSSNFQKCIPNITNRTHTTSTSKKNDNNHVKIVEVGPRDGLQNETRVISTNAKVYLIQKLMDSGCKTIETASFVSPKWIPAMANSKEVMEELYHWRKEKNKKTKGEDEDSVIFSVLTPNLKGFENAMSIGKSDDNDSDDDDDDGIRAVDEVAIFGAASESFSQKNIACSHVPRRRSVNFLVLGCSTALCTRFNVLHVNQPTRSRHFAEKASLRWMPQNGENDHGKLTLTLQS